MCFALLLFLEQKKHLWYTKYIIIFEGIIIMLKTISDLLLNIPDLFILWDEQMSLHTTFRIGGPARLFLDAHSVDAALRALDILGALSAGYQLVANGADFVEFHIPDDGTYSYGTVGSSSSALEVRWKTNRERLHALINSPDGQ